MRTYTIIPENDDVELIAIRIAAVLRRAGLAVDTIYSGTAAKKAERARSRGVSVALMVDRPSSSFPVASDFKVHFRAYGSAGDRELSDAQQALSLEFMVLSTQAGLTPVGATPSLNRLTITYRIKP